MGDIVNLRQARKSRKRADDESQAAANRLKYGRTKSDKRLAVMARQHHDSIVDGAKLEPDYE
jgi:Domain of unknown function (DUF4169)